MAVRLYRCLMYDSRFRTMIPEAGRTLEMLNLQESRFAPHLSRDLIVRPLPEQRNSLDQ